MSKRLFFFLLLLFLYCCFCNAFAETSAVTIELKQQKFSNQGDILILFDQSQSMNAYNPKSVSELVILTFLKTFGLRNRIILFGFAEQVVEYVRIEKTGNPDIQQIRRQIADISLKEKVTDFEPALSFLDDYADDVALAIIVTDGQPDIWDRGLKYLSQKVYHDSRYQELNDKNKKLQAAGKNANQLHDELNTDYEQRNIELLNTKLDALKQSYQDRLIFFDIANKYAFLAEWANKAAAQLVEISINSSDKASLEQGLRVALANIQQIASELLAEELPQDYDSKIESTLNKEISDDDNNIIISPVPSIEISPTPEAKLIGKPETTLTKIQQFFSLQRKLLLLSFLLFCWLIYRLRLRWAREKTEPTFNLLDENLFVDSVHQQISSISASSLESAKNYIEHQIRIATKEGNHQKVRLLQLEKLKYRFDRRISLRVSVPPGMMDVLLTNSSGVEHFEPIRDVSLHALMFEYQDIDQEKITQIRINEPLEYLSICSYRIRKRDDTHLVVMLDDFEDSLKNRMRWVEIITRIEEMSESA